MAARKATPAVIAISAGRYGIGRDNSSRRLGGNDFMSGGDGDDNVSDGSTWDHSADIAYGGAGDDIMDAFNDPPHMDIIYCGPGDDLVYTDGVDRLLDCEEVILGQEPADAWDRLMNLN